MPSIILSAEECGVVTPIRMVTSFLPALHRRRYHVPVPVVMSRAGQRGTV